MSATSEDSLICDFAETYHILDWRGLPIDLAATLASGLPEQSRSKMKLRGERATTEQVLLARICDLLAQWIFAHTNDECPPSLVSMLTDPPKAEPKHKVFKNGEAFMHELNRFIGGNENG